MKITLNRTDRCNKYTHAQGIYVMALVFIYIYIWAVSTTAHLCTSRTSRTYFECLVR